MAYLTDTTQSFTITLVGEGAGSLDSITINNSTTGTEYSYNVGTATWTPSVPIAYPNDNIEVTATVGNTGSLADTIFAEFVSGDVTTSDSLIQTESVAVGQFLDAYWSFVMPAANVSITINAGHEE